MIEKIQAIFIDRDGTIGGNDDVIYPGEFELFPSAKKAIDILKEREVTIFSFTNQPGISRGEASKEDFIKELSGFGFDEVFICSHGENEECNCRKPRTGLLEIAAIKNNLNLHKCVVIGDRWSDMLAAEQAGLIKILVLTGAGNDAICKYKDKWIVDEADYIAKNILDAVNWLISEKYI